MHNHIFKSKILADVPIIDTEVYAAPVREDMPRGSIANDEGSADIA